MPTIDQAKVKRMVDKYTANPCATPEIWATLEPLNEQEQKEFVSQANKATLSTMFDTSKEAMDAYLKLNNLMVDKGLKISFIPLWSGHKNWMVLMNKEGKVTTITQSVSSGQLISMCELAIKILS